MMDSTNHIVINFTVSHSFSGLLPFLLALWLPDNSIHTQWYNNSNDNILWRYDMMLVKYNVTYVYMYMYLFFGMQKKQKKMYANVRKEHPSGPSALLWSLSAPFCPFLQNINAWIIVYIFDMYGKAHKNNIAVTEHELKCQKAKFFKQINS